MEIQNGFIMIARNLLDSEIFYDKKPEWLKIWIYILLSVQHKNYRKLKRGQGFFKYQDIATKTRTTYKTVEHCVSWLKSGDMIETKKGTQGIVISVLKYDKYQNIDNYKREDNKESIGGTKGRQGGQYKQECNNDNNSNVTLQEQDGRNQVRKKKELTQVEINKLIEEWARELCDKRKWDYESFIINSDINITKFRQEYFVPPPEKSRPRYMWKNYNLINIKGRFEEWIDEDYKLTK